jgi:hypothetical protein
VANNAVYKNLCRNNPLPAIARNAGGTISQVAGGGLLFPAGTNLVTNFVEIGTSAVDFSTGNADYLVIVWDKQPLSGYNVTSYAPILYDTTNNANPASVWLDSGLNGIAPRAAIGTGAGNNAIAGVSGYGQGFPRQIAFSRVGTVGTLFINGVQVAQSTGMAATLQASTAAVTKLAGNHTATIFKTMGCKLGGVYDRTPTEIVSRDWDRSRTRFA